MSPPKQPAPGIANASDAFANFAMPVVAWHNPDVETEPAASAGRQHSRFVSLIIKANAPPPPEQSWLFRVVTLVTVIVGVLACASVGELSFGASLLATVAIALGMTFSGLTREHPWQWVKILLAFAVIVVFAEFISQLFGVASTGELASVEAPLSGLFVWVQVVHAFDVPARRDLLFSIAAAAALVTVAGAQAQSSNFLLYVLAWLIASLIGLACSWHSMVGGEGRLRVAGLVYATILVLAVAVAVDAVLPPPRTAQAIHLPSSISNFLPLPKSDGLTEGGAGLTQPAKAGNPGNVGGYIGMSGPLDTALRGSLGNTTVFKVRADQPGYFLGITYSDWNGQSWSNPNCAAHEISSGSPFYLNSSQNVPAGPSTNNVQTFYVEQPLPNLLFATSTPTEVYFPAKAIAVGCDGSIRSTVAMTPGTVYTVISSDDEYSSLQLAAVPASAFPPVPASGLKEDPWYWSGFAADLVLPPDNRYSRVAALARSIVEKAHPTSLVGVVQALENWMGAHTQYSLDIPPLLPGQDTVNEFLFGTRKGFCEQISTSLAVMLRTLGIPAREATGYVPGSFDPLSDLYTIQAKDAHAWVQVYFPGMGWQSFDPTAYVPLSPADPGAVLLSDVGHFFGGLPWLPIGIIGGLGAAAYAQRFVVRRRRRRPATWAGRWAWELERAGRRAGLARTAGETLFDYSQRLPTTVAVAQAVGVVTHAGYSDWSPTETQRAEADSILRRISADLKSRRGTSRLKHRSRLGH